MTNFFTALKYILSLWSTFSLQFTLLHLNFKNLHGWLDRIFPHKKDIVAVSIFFLAQKINPSELTKLSTVDPGALLV